jgi:hypothetical protein
MKKSKRPFKRWEKTIREDADWDFVFIWILEKKKLEHMLKFWEDYWRDRVKGSEFCQSYKDKTCTVITDLRRCIKILGILIDQTDCVWSCESPGFYTEKVPGKELWELKSKDPDSPGICHQIGYVNLKNAERILGKARFQSIMKTRQDRTSTVGYPNYLSCMLENEIYLEKARHLYYQIRYNREQSWWE